MRVRTVDGILGTVRTRRPEDDKALVRVRWDGDDYDCMVEPQLLVEVKKEAGGAW